MTRRHSNLVLKKCLAGLSAAQAVKLMIGGLNLKESREEWDHCGDLLMDRICEKAGPLNDPMTLEQAKTFVMAVADEMKSILEYA